MLRTRNHYCSNCLSTQRFVDLGESLLCERCTKQLDRSVGVCGVASDATIGATSNSTLAALQQAPPAPRPRVPRPQFPRRESA